MSSAKIISKKLDECLVAGYAPSANKCFTREASLKRGFSLAILTRLPGRTHAQIGVPIVARIVVDVEAIRIEVANVDELAVRRLGAQPMCFIPSVITGDCRKKTLP